MRIISIFLLLMVILISDAGAIEIHDAIRMRGPINMNSNDLTNIDDVSFDAIGQDMDLNGRKFTDSANGSTATDLMTIWQGWDKINKTDSIDPNRINLSKNWTGQMHNVTNGTAAQDAATYSQVVMMSHQVYKTVGPYEWCDYITDGTDDQAQINAAQAYQEKVIIYGPIVLGAAFTANANTYLQFIGTITAKPGINDRMAVSMNTNVTIDGGVWNHQNTLNAVTKETILLTGDNCSIINAKIYNAPYQAIALKGDDGRVVNNFVYNTQNGTTDARGIMVDDADRTIVSHNTVKNTHTQGISIYHSDYSICTENEVDTTDSGFGIGAYQCSYVQLDDNTIKNTYIEGMNLEECFYSSMSSNIIDTTINDFGMSIWKGEHNTADGNVIKSPCFTGITIQGSSYNLVSGNKIYNPSHVPDHTPVYMFLQYSVAGESCYGNMWIGNMGFDLQSPRRVWSGFGNAEIGGGIVENTQYSLNMFIGYNTSERVDVEDTELYEAGKVIA